MKTKSFVIVILLGVAFWASLIFSKICHKATFEWAGHLASFGLVLALLTTIIGRIVKHGVSSKTGLLLPAVCVVFLLVPLLFRASLGHLDEWSFNRDLVEYSRVVNDIKSGKIHTGQMFSTIKISQIGQLPGRAIDVRAARCNNGTVVVEFYTLLQGALGDDCGVVFDDCDDPSISEVHRPPRYHQQNFPVHIQGSWYKYCDG